MASSGTSIARSRSLRKPTAGGSTDLSHKPSSSSSSSSAAAAPKDRNTSPSRLPALRNPSARPGSRTATSNDPSSATAPTTTSSASTFLKRSRPVSGHGPSRSGSVSSSSRAQPAAAATSQVPRSQHDPVQQQQQQQPVRNRYPPNASASGDVATTKRPTSSGGLPSPSRTRPGGGGPSFGHARAKSTVTSSAAASALGNAPTKGLSNPPVLRPPSQPSANRSAGNPTSSSSGGGGGGGAAPKARPLSNHTRNPSVGDRLHPGKPTTASNSHTTTATAGPSTSSSSSVVASAPRLTKKPAFSTNQQYYSPLRKQGPKPLTATYLAPPSPSKLPSNVAASAETSRLQTELLQLHLLHRDADAVSASWHRSAKDKLRQKHEALAAQSTELTSTEREVEEQRNIAALRAWGGHANDDNNKNNNSRDGGEPGMIPLDEKIQILDAVLTGLWGLDGPGGRYARVARKFERWCDRLVEVESARRQYGTGEHAVRLLGADGEDDLFVGGLDDSWKSEVSGLMRRLGGWEDQLRQLGGVPQASPGDDDHDGSGAGGREDKSALARTLEGSGSMVRSMLAELSVMEDIEREAVEREKEWVRMMIRDEADDGREEGREAQHDTPRAGAIWRLL